jgi:hypothetical protein
MYLFLEFGMNCDVATAGLYLMLKIGCGAVARK